MEATFSNPAHRTPYSGQDRFTITPFAEIAIPLESLRFQKADSSTWGINVSRTIRRKNENVYWQLIPRDAGRMGLFRMSQAGKLDGLTGIKSGGNLEFEPYLLAS